MKSVQASVLVGDDVEGLAIDLKGGVLDTVGITTWFMLDWGSLAGAEVD